MDRRPSELEEAAAVYWTLQSKARVGSLQHLISTAPWFELLGAYRYLQQLKEPADE